MVLVARDDASAEAFYGENFVKHLRERGEDVNDLEVAERQVLSMRLYEGRVASLQRAAPGEGPADRREEPSAPLARVAAAVTRSPPSTSSVAPFLRY